MSDLRELVVKLIADPSGYDRGTKQAVKDNEDIKKSSSGLGKGFLSGAGAALGFIGTAAGITGVGAAVGAVGSFLGDTIKAASDAQVVMNQTNAVLQSTGGISGQTAKSIGDYADAQMRLTGIDDQSIQGAENMIATFTNIRGAAFQPTTKAVLDMATAMNGGAIPSAEQLRQTAIQVGKALNDPVQGVQALQRVGVKLSATQMDQVKHFMAVGDVASAQKVILGELSKEFGGASDAAGKGLAGQLAILQGVFHKVQETIGGAVIPIITRLLQAAQPLIQSLADALPGAIATVQAQVKPFVEKLGELANNFLKNKPLMDGLKNAFAQLKPLIGPVLIALGILTAISFAPLAILIGVIAGIALGLKKLWEVTEPVRTVLGNFLGVLGNLKDLLITGVQHAITAVVEKVQAFWKATEPLRTAIGNLIAKAIELRQKALEALQPAIHNVSQQLGVLHSWFNDKVLPVIRAVHAFFQDHILPVLQAVGGFIRDQVVAQLQRMWSFIQGSVLPILAKLGGFIKDQVIAHFQQMWSIISTRVLPLLGQLAGLVAGTVGRGFQVLGTVLGTVFGKVGDVLGALGRLKDFFGNLHLEFPKIKMPHFSIVGSFNLNPPSVPHLDIQWYKTGGVFMSPSIIGVGEAGPEAVIPLDRLGGMTSGNGGQPVEIHTHLILNGRELGEAITPFIMQPIVNHIRTHAGIRAI